MLIFVYTWEKISETWSCGELYRERLRKYLGIAGVSLSVGIQRQVVHGTFDIIAIDP